MFDHPENLARARRICSRIAITHAPEYRSTALLLVGWFAAQLKLEFARAAGSDLIFTDAKRNETTIMLQVEAGRSISRCELTSERGSLQVQRDAAGDFFRVEVRLPGDRTYRHLLPAGSNSTTSLLLEEIGGGGQHRVYLKALAVTERLL